MPIAVSPAAVFCHWFISGQCKSVVGVGVNTEEEDINVSEKSVVAEGRSIVSDDEDIKKSLEVTGFKDKSMVEKIEGEIVVGKQHFITPEDSEQIGPIDSHIFVTSIPSLSVDWTWWLDNCVKFFRQKATCTEDWLVRISALSIDTMQGMLLWLQSIKWK